MEYDTKSYADVIQRSMIQKMSPGQRLSVSLQLYWSARELKTASIRRQRPDWSEARILQAVKALF